MLAFYIIASHDGLCPLSGKFIVAGRSRIAPLAVSMPPNPAVTFYSAERGVWIVANAEAKRIHARDWARADEVERFNRRYSFEEQEALAVEWRDELRRMKREGDRLYGRQHGRQRRVRSKGRRVLA